MAFTLPNLPYKPDALEPTIDKMTMEIHHGKHHNAYVTNLNKAIEGTPGKADIEKMSIEDICANLANIPADIRGAVRNNGGGHYNHSMFWTIMAPGKSAGGSGGGEPSGALADAIKKSFGSFADFKTKLNDAGTKRFGSGWAWLIVDKSKNLAITSTPNQDNPLMKEAEVQGTPILGVDVWEHAYYLKYQNKRPDYLNAWWDVVNWTEVASRFAKAK